MYISVPAGLYKPKFFSVNSSMIRLTWEEPANLNGPAPLYSVEKTVPSLNYPPLVVQGTRFPGGGYYLFPPEIIPPNVAYTGEYQLGHSNLIFGIECFGDIVLQSFLFVISVKVEVYISLRFGGCRCQGQNCMANIMLKSFSRSNQFNTKITIQFVSKRVFIVPVNCTNLKILFWQGFGWSLRRGKEMVCCCLLHQLVARRSFWFYSSSLADHGLYLILRVGVTLCCYYLTL